MTTSGVIPIPLGVGDHPQPPASQKQGLSLAAFHRLLDSHGGRAAFSLDAASLAAANGLDAASLLPPWLLTGEGGASGVPVTTEVVKYLLVLPTTRERRVAYSDLLLTPTTMTKTTGAASAPSPAPLVGAAMVFLSHAYGMRFLDVVDALAAREEAMHRRAHPHPSSASGDGRAAVASSASGDGRAAVALPAQPTYYYFDLLVVNQHPALHSSPSPTSPQSSPTPTSSPVVSFEALRDEFGGGVEAVGHTALLLDWRSPEPLRRLWCVFELFTTLSRSVPLSILQPPDAEEAFRLALVGNFDALVAATCNVDVARASALVDEDAKNIRAVLSGGVALPAPSPAAPSPVPGAALAATGFLAVNQAVLAGLRSWMAASAREALDALSPSDRAEQADDLLIGYGKLLSQMGRDADAEAAVREALEARTRRLGAGHVLTLEAVRTLVTLRVSLDRARFGVETGSDSYSNQAEPKDEDEAEAELAKTLPKEIAAAAAGAASPPPDPFSPSIPAVTLLRRTLDLARAAHGPDAAITLSLCDDLAVVLREEFREITEGRSEFFIPTPAHLRLREQSEKLFVAALSGRERLLGPAHADTLDTLEHLALLRTDQGRHGEAHALLRRLVEGRRALLGSSHTATLTAIQALAISCHQSAVGKRPEAELLFAEALEGKRRVLGDDHPDTILALVNSALLASSKGEDGRAVELVSAAVGSARAVFGPQHALTESYLYSYIRILRKAGKRREAAEVTAEGLAIQAFRLARQVGPDHPRALNALVDLGDALAEVGRVREAEASFTAAAEGYARFRPDDPGDTCRLLPLCRLGDLACRTGRVAEAAATFRGCVDALLKSRSEWYGCEMDVVRQSLKVLRAANAALAAAAEGQGAATESGGAGDSGGGDAGAAEEESPRRVREEAEALLAALLRGPKRIRKEALLALGREVEGEDDEEGKDEEEDDWEDGEDDEEGDWEYGEEGEGALVEGPDSGDEEDADGEAEEDAGEDDEELAAALAASLADAGAKDGAAVSPQPARDRGVGSGGESDEAAMLAAAIALSLADSAQGAGDEGMARG
jgi:tetratricopeptide (TPR) repeat protein